jgi:hypothetical protein
LNFFSVSFKLWGWEFGPLAESYVLKAFILIVGLTQPETHWVPEHLSLAWKCPGCVADHSPPSSAKVKNEWSCTSTPPCALMSYAGTNLPSHGTWPDTVISLLQESSTVVVQIFQYRPEFVGLMRVSNDSSNYRISLISSVMISYTDVWKFTWWICNEIDAEPTTVKCDTVIFPGHFPLYVFGIVFTSSQRLSVSHFQINLSWTHDTRYWY